MLTDGGARYRATLGSLRIVARCGVMSDRTAEFEAAIRAQAGLISEAQELLTRYLSKEIEAPALIDALLKLLDGPQQHEAERLAREALGEQEPGNIA